MTVALVDDQALGAVLRGSIPRRLRRLDVATTGYWYVRLCQAVVRTTERPGALSGPFADVPPAIRDRAIAAVLDLPDTIALRSLRELGPTIGRLRSRHALNVLGIEVVAAAIHLDATVFLSTPSPRLEAALAAEDVPFRLLA